MPRPSRALPRSAVLLTAALLAACSSRGEHRESKRTIAVITSSDTGPGRDVHIAVSGAGTSTSPLDAKPTFATGADGSVSIHSQNGAFVMSLRHDSVVMAFSDSIRNVIRQEVAESMRKDSMSNAGDRSALGEVLKGVVASSVSGAMREVFDKSRGFPVSSVRDISYESGTIRFDFTKKPTWDFTGMENDHVPLMSQFHPADAARFVGAVRAQMKRS